MADEEPERLSQTSSFSVSVGKIMSALNPELGEWLNLNKAKFQEYFEKGTEAANSFFEELAKRKEEAVEGGNKKLDEIKKHYQELRRQEKEALDALRAKLEQTIEAHKDDVKTIAELKEEFQNAVTAEKAKCQEKLESLKARANDLFK